MNIIFKKTDNKYSMNLQDMDMEEAIILRTLILNLMKPGMEIAPSNDGFTCSLDKEKIK